MNYKEIRGSTLREVNFPSDLFLGSKMVNFCRWICLSLPYRVGYSRAWARKLLCWEFKKICKYLCKQVFFIKWTILYVTSTFMHFADAIYSFLSNQFNNLVVLEFPINISSNIWRSSIYCYNFEELNMKISKYELKKTYVGGLYECFIFISITKVPNKRKLTPKHWNCDTNAF